MPRRQERQEVPPGRAEVVVQGDESQRTGPLAGISDFLFHKSDPQVIFGSLSAAALLGYQVALRAESLTEATGLPPLLYRTTYTPSAAYELFDALGPQGRAEYQYLNVLSTGAFPFLVAIFFATSIGRVFDRAGLGREWNLFPFIFAAVATLESLGISFLLFKYPAVHPNLAVPVSMLGSLKVRLFWYSVLMLLLGAVWMTKVIVQDIASKKRR